MNVFIQKTSLWAVLLSILGLAVSSCSTPNSQLGPTTASADNEGVTGGSFLCSEDSDQDGISNQDEGAYCIEAPIRMQKIFKCLDDAADEDKAAGKSNMNSALRRSRDTDNDRTPDFLDLDSDEDGISDLAESGGENIDLDGDGKCDTVCVLVLMVRDHDQGGVPDYLDSDSNNNKISDLEEKGALCASSDGRTCDSDIETIAFVPTTLEDLGLDSKTPPEAPPPVSPPPEISVGTTGGSTGGIVLLPNANLSGITLSSGTLTPAFSKDVTSYTVSTGTSTITVTPLKEHPRSTMTHNGTAITSDNPSGNTTLSYGTDSTITIVVTAIDGTTKTYTITATLRGYSSQEAYVKASNTGASDRFGWSVAISGDTLVIGAYQESSNATGINGNESDNSAANSGAAYVFVRSGTTWSQQAYIKASNTGASDRFGWSVAISGDTLVVGAYQESSNATGINGNESDNSASTSGAVYVFVRSGTTWSQQAYVKASNTGASDRFGYSVAISGDTLVVGAYLESSNATGVNGDQSDNSTSSGAAYVFLRSGTTWTQQAYLKASNTGLNDNFGFSVAISGDTLVVGAYQEDSNATGVNGDQNDNSTAQGGAVYVFVRSETIWNQQAYVKASNTGFDDRFGYAVAISGDTLVVGAYTEDSNATGINGNQSDNSVSASGAVYVFVRSGTTWSQQAYVKASNTGASDQFGQYVAVSGDTLLVGATVEDSNATGINGNESDNSASASGAAYIFSRIGTTWSQQAYLKASNTGASDQFGSFVAISGDTLVVGAYLESSNATGVNGDQSDNSASQSGAAYVFVR